MYQNYHICVKNYLSAVVPAKSDSDVMFCLQSYWGLIIDRSRVYLSYPQDRINTQVIYRFALVQAFQVAFYRTIVNKVLRHCHSRFARQ